MSTTEMDERPVWKCINCGQEFRATPYDIGSGPEVSCPNCEWCFGAEGQPLQPLDHDLMSRLEQAAKTHRGRHRR